MGLEDCGLTRRLSSTSALFLGCCLGMMSGHDGGNLTRENPTILVGRVETVLSRLSGLILKKGSRDRGPGRAAYPGSETANGLPFWSWPSPERLRRSREGQFQEEENATVLATPGCAALHSATRGCAPAPASLLQDEWARSRPVPGGSPGRGGELMARRSHRPRTVASRGLDAVA